MTHLGQSLELRLIGFVPKKQPSCRNFFTLIDRGFTVKLRLVW